MFKQVNDGVESWTGVLLDDEFNPGDMHDSKHNDVDNFQRVIHTNLGTITVLDRMTGYGCGAMDTETGFRDMAGNFWLATGRMDVRRAGCKTFGDAIQWIKDNANTCTGDQT